MEGAMRTKRVHLAEAREFGVPTPQAMQRSLHRILTTHTGSLPRPPDLREMLSSRATDAQVDEQAFQPRVRSAVAETVAQQVACGIDIVGDGELGKPNFVMYVADRLRGMEGWDDTL